MVAGRLLMGDGAPEEGEPGLVQVLQLQAGLHEADDGRGVLAHRQEALSLLQELLPHAVCLQQRHAPAATRARMRASGIGALFMTRCSIATLEQCLPAGLQ